MVHNLRAACGGGGIDLKASASWPAIKGLTDATLLLSAERHVVVEEVVLVHPDLVIREEGRAERQRLRSRP